MMAVVAEWERVQRLDPAWAAAGVEQQAGVRLVVEGPCPGGQVGAAYVRWPDGHRSVLTWQPGRSLAEVAAGPLAVLGAVRRGGYPGPEVELAVEVDGAVVLVQQLLPGAPVARFTAGLLDQVLALVERQAGALAGRPEVPAVRLFLREDGPGFCRHAPLRRHSARAAALERWVLGVAEELPGDALPGDDAVHVDLQPSNLLAVDGTVTGVVDWDGAGRGDRRLDLVTLRFGLATVAVDDAVVRRLDAVLDAVPPPVLVPAWAHTSLRMVDWAIRHFAPEDVGRWLDLAEQRAP
jgi:hypothetical protein